MLSRYRRWQPAVALPSLAQHLSGFRLFQVACSYGRSMGQSEFRLQLRDTNKTHQGVLYANTQIVKVVLFVFCSTQIQGPE